MSFTARRSLIAVTFAAFLGGALIGCDGARQASAETAGSPSAAAATGAERSDSAQVELADSIARARQDSINRARPDYVVDSILPIEEQFRRFREGTRTVSAFEGGARSRDALLTAILDGVQRADTALLDRLTLSRDEYAWLVYPSSVHVSGPMQQAPQVAWFLLEQSSASGRARLMARLGGQPLGVRRMDCDAEVAREGENRIVTGCRVERVDAGGARLEQRLFGPLIARDGVWKVLSWANGF
jgi:hypothetical protein